MHSSLETRLMPRALIQGCAIESEKTALGNFWFDSLQGRCSPVRFGMETGMHFTRREVARLWEEALMPATETNAATNWQD